MNERLSREAWIRMATSRLREVGVEQPRAEAGLLLALALGIDRLQLAVHPETPVPESAQSEAEALLDRRARREPYAYLTGQREFFGLPFEVTPDVLIPRPETELIVERAMELIAHRENFYHIADIGTGSGAIAISLACSPSPISVVASDLSEAALAVARRNAGLNKVPDDKLSFRPGSLFEAFEPGDCFDIICSNPPYVPDFVREGLQAEVRDFEPHTALFAGSDGLDVIRPLLTQAPDWLRPGGVVLMEFGQGQASMIEALIRSDPRWADFTLHKDLAGIERTLEATRH